MTANQPEPTSARGHLSGSDSKPVTVLGDFELRRELGRGGMGTVYEAWQRSLQRVVALKVLNSHVSSSRIAVQRFQREAQAAAKLHHTHIVPIFAQGEDQGTYFYAMEYVDGPSLNMVVAEERDQLNQSNDGNDLGETVVVTRDLSSSGPQTPPAARSRSSSPSTDSSTSTAALGQKGQGAAEARFAAVAESIASVADALSYAHQRGVVHRDIKPHNLMLGSDGRLRISDFGLARLTEQPTVTITGEMLGSPMYMSPEQIVEGPSKVDARTDVYSLGVTLYEWLTLKPPFPGETRESVISMIVNMEPTPPREHDPQIPLDLETICLKAMERDCNRRYQSAAEFRDDLRRYLDKQAIRAKRASWTARAKKFVDRHQFASLALFAGGSLVVAAILGVALFRKQSSLTTQSQATEAAKAEADQIVDYMRSLLELGISKEGAKLALPVAQEFVKTATEVSPAEVIHNVSTAEPERVDTPARIARRALPEFYDAIKPPSWQELPEEIIIVLDEALATRDSNPETGIRLLDLVSAPSGDQFEAVQMHAMLAGRVGKYEMLEADAEKLVRLQATNPHAYVWRGIAHLLLGRGEQALEDLNFARELDPSSVWARTLQGLALVQVNRAAEAVVMFDEVLREVPTLVVGLLGRAVAHYAAGRVPKAITDVSRVLELKPDDCEALTIRGDYHAAAGDFAAATEDFSRAMAKSDRTPALLSRWFRAAFQKRKPGTIPQIPRIPNAKEPQRGPDADARIKKFDHEPSGRRLIGVFVNWRP